LAVPKRLRYFLQRDADLQVPPGVAPRMKSSELRTPPHEVLRTKREPYRKLGRRASLSYGAVRTSYEDGSASFLVLGTLYEGLSARAQMQSARRAFKREAKTFKPFARRIA
jgi:hypothetical protein